MGTSLKINLETEEHTTVKFQSINEFKRALWNNISETAQIILYEGLLHGYIPGTVSLRYYLLYVCVCKVNYVNFSIFCSLLPSMHI